ncbi:MAG: PDZ domain-containing protein [Cyclobacteriaceae bacterium]
MKNIIAAIAIMISTCLFAQRPITSVSFELFGDYIILPVTLDNSRELNFIFDTGSGLTIIDDEVGLELGFTGKEIEMNTTHNTMQLFKHHEVEINGFPIEKNIKVYATDLEHLEISLGKDIDGIIGYDIMHHHTIKINYSNQTMDIYEHGYGPKNGKEVVFDLNVSIPTVNGNVILNNEEAHPGTFFIMTGAGTTVDFNSPYAKKYNVLDKTGKHYSYLVKGLSDEETLHYEGHVISFEFGGHTLEDLPIGISQAKSGIQAHEHVAGIIGNHVLSQFDITIDLPKRRMYLEENENFGETRSVNCSGIDLQFAHGEPHLLIHRVFEDSPAAEAGIQVNDELVAINDQPVSTLALPDIQAMLRKDGETVKLKILQGSKINHFEIELKSLIK